MLTDSEIATLTLVGEIGLLAGTSDSLGVEIQRMAGMGLLVVRGDDEYLMAHGLTPEGKDVLRPYLPADYPVRKLTVIR